MSMVSNLNGSRLAVVHTSDIKSCDVLIQRLLKRLNKHSTFSVSDIELIAAGTFGQQNGAMTFFRSAALMELRLG